MIVREASADDIMHVCRHMRAHNARELLATSWWQGEFARDRVAEQLIGMVPLAICHVAVAAAVDRPAAALAGAWLTTPGVAGIQVIATDQWLTVATGLYRWLKREGLPRLTQAGIRLAETTVIDGPASEREWLARLGLIELQPALPRGRNGELFIHMAWINPNV